MTFRRRKALEVRSVDGEFRVHRLADFELCLKLRPWLGGRAVVVATLPVICHQHRL